MDEHETLQNWLKNQPHDTKFVLLNDENVLALLNKETHSIYVLEVRK